MIESVQFDHTKKDVVICGRCNGEGKRPNYNKLHAPLEECDRCGGSGRLRVTVSVMFEPLVTQSREEAKYIELDAESKKEK